jgi:hypothetical protein
MQKYGIVSNPRTQNAQHAIDNMQAYNIGVGQR